MASIDHISGQVETSENEPDPDSTDGQERKPAPRYSLSAAMKRLWDRRKPRTLRGTIEESLRHAPTETDSFTPQERAMLRNILRFGGLRVEDVMVPRADIEAIDGQASLSELIFTFQRAGYSRIPVYRETLDDPYGMVHIKDLVRWMTDHSTQRPARRMREDQPALRIIDSEPANIELKDIDLSTPVVSVKLLRDVLYVPPSMPVVDLLLRMQSTRIHLALVVDEYGGTDGLVSIEDLIEEVVGEIEDEHDVDSGPLLNEDPVHGLVAAARAPVEELELYVGVDLMPEGDEDEIETLGGLVFALAGRVPVKGELIKHPSGIEFEVLDADPRRIKRLRIHIARFKDESEKNAEQSAAEAGE